jgi:hypothetical protein
MQLSVIVSAVPIAGDVFRVNYWRGRDSPCVVCAIIGACFVMWPLLSGCHNMYQLRDAVLVYCDVEYFAQLTENAAFTFKNLRLYVASFVWF